LLVGQTVSYERVVKEVAKMAIRGNFPSHLPRMEVAIEPGMDGSADEENRRENHKIVRFEARFSVCSPPSISVPRYVNVAENFRIAPLPARPIEKDIPGPGLLVPLLLNNCQSTNQRQPKVKKSMHL
jgi:transposase